MYLIWVLIVHVIKGAFGILLLNKMPKTFEIIENVAKNPNFDESKIIELIKKEIKDSFMIKWEENKCKFFLYFISTALCLFIDLLIFLIQAFKFGQEEWLLMQTCMLFTIIIFIITDVIYFLWYFTLQFIFPKEILDPIQKAVLGSIGDLSSFVRILTNFINVW